MTYEILESDWLSPVAERFPYKKFVALNYPAIQDLQPIFGTKVKITLYFGQNDFLNY